MPSDVSGLDLFLYLKERIIDFSWDSNKISFIIYFIFFGGYWFGSYLVIIDFSWDSNKISFIIYFIFFGSYNFKYERKCSWILLQYCEHLQEKK